MAMPASRNSPPTIEASAGRGYRLVRTSDRLLPEEIARHYHPKTLRGALVHHETIDSTNPYPSCVRLFMIRNRCCALNQRGPRHRLRR